MHFYLEYTLISVNLNWLSIIRNKIKYFKQLDLINDKRMHFYLEYKLISVNLNWFSIIRNKVK